MDTFNVKLVFPDAKLTDLAKLPAAIMGNLPGGTTLINVFERFIKNYEGGLPVDVKLIITEDSLQFKLSAFTKYVADNVSEIEIPFYQIYDVRCVVDEFLTNLNLRLYKAMNVIIDTSEGQYKIVDQPDVTTLYKSRAQKIADAINRARG